MTSVTETFNDSQAQVQTDLIAERIRQRKQQRILSGETTPDEQAIIDAEVQIEPISQEEVLTEVKARLPGEGKIEGPVETAVRNIAEIPRGVVGGVRNAFQEVLDTANEMAAWMDENFINLRFGDPEDEPFIQLPGVMDPSTPTGQTTQAISQFVVGFFTSKRLKGVRSLGGFKKAAAAGAIADVGFIPHDTRLANLIQETNALGLGDLGIIEYLAAKPGDSVAEGKFKNALEGLALGVAAEPIIRGLGIGIRLYRAARFARRAEAGEAAKAAKEAAEKEAVATTAAFDKHMGGKAPAIVRDPKTGRSNINYNKLNTEDDVIALIDKEAKAQGVVSDLEVAQLAEELGMTVDDVLQGGVESVLKSAPHVKAARNLMVAMGEDLSSISKDFAERGLANVPDTEKAAFIAKTMKFRGVLAVVQGATAEGGRLLRQFRQLAGAQIQADAIDGILKANGPDTLENIVELFAKSDGKQITQMIKLLATEEARGALPFFTRGSGIIAQIKNSLGMLEAVGYRLWVNGLLSAIPTQAVNIGGTGGYLGLRASRLWATSRYNRRFPSSDPDSISVGEAQARLQGLRQSIPEAWAVARQSYQRNLPVGAAKFTSRTTAASPFAGRTPDDVGVEGMFARGVYYLSRGFDQTVTAGLERIGSRAMNAEDAFFKTMIGNWEINGLAYRQALTEGLEEGSEEFIKRNAFLKSNPPKWMLGEAQKSADEITFTSTPRTSGGRKVVQLAGDVPGLRYFGVFARTAGNLFARGAIGETPLTLLSRQTQDAMRAGGAVGEEAMARVAMAGLVGMTVFDMTLNGIITGPGPSDPRMRQALERAGWKPNSFNVGKLMGVSDRYVDYSRLDPLAWPITINATMAEFVMWGGDKFTIEEEDLQTEMLASVATLLSDRTYVRGISDLFGALALPKEWQGKRFKDIRDNMAATMTAPSISFKARQQVDQYRRWAPGYLNKWRNRVPMLSETLPPIRGIFGEPLFYSATLGPVFISPIATASETIQVDFLMNSVADGVYDPLVPSLVDKLPMIYAELAKVGAPVMTLPKTLDGLVDLSSPERAEEYGRYMELVGTVKIGGKDILESAWFMLTNPGYQDMGLAEGKAQIWRNLVNGYRKEARKQLLEENRELAKEYVVERALNTVRKNATKQQVEELRQ